MKDFIGVREIDRGVMVGELASRCLNKSDDLHSIERELKQQLLLFDKIAIISLEEVIEKLRKCGSIENDKLDLSPFIELADQIEFLAESGMVYQPKLEDIDVRPSEEVIKDFVSAYKYQKQSERNVRKGGKYFRSFMKIFLKVARYEYRDNRSLIESFAFRNLKALQSFYTVKSDGFFHEANAMEEIAESYIIRAISILMSYTNNVDVFPIISYRQSDGMPDGQSHVFQIVLKYLPCPDDTTPWEQITDYRNDPDSKQKFLAFRRWMNEVATGRLTTAEIEEKIEYLLQDYQKHIDFHKMKTKTGSLETIITTTAGVVESIAKLKLEKIAKYLFILRNRRLALMEAEMKAPGREVAYIIKTRETFSKG